MTTRHRSSIMTLAVFAIALLATCVMTACSADVTGPSQECINEITPPTFRIVLNSGDTLPRITNHYLVPHRNVDTLRQRLFDNSGTITIPLNWGAGYCETALDSAALHAPGGTRTWVSP